MVLQRPGRRSLTRVLGSRYRLQVPPGPLSRRTGEEPLSGAPFVTDTIDHTREGVDRRFLCRGRMPVPVGELADWHFRPGALDRLIPPWQDVRVVQDAGPMRVGAETVQGNRAIVEKSPNAPADQTNLKCTRKN